MTTKDVQTQALTVRTQVDANEALVKSFPTMLQLGKTLLDSGFLPQTIKSPAQALALILRGQEMGLGPMESLCTLQVIQGKVVIPPEVMLRQARQRGGVNCEQVESTAKVCTLTFTRPGAKPHTETFTIEDAEALGVAGKDNYRKQARVMLRWRCISAGLRFYASDCFGGPVYAPGELEERTEIEQEAPPPPAPPKVEEEIKDAELVASMAPGELPLGEPKTPEAGAWETIGFDEEPEEKWVKALLEQRKRIGDAAFFGVCSFTGLETFEDICRLKSREKKEELFKALKALGGKTKTDAVKEKLAGVSA